jgi:beta-hydroxylase
MKTAFFSILAPGKHIAPHRGPSAGVLRYHLGLKIPVQAERCRIRVRDEYAHWREGASLVFDDTYEHEVWNDTDEERVVLFLDVVRPLPFPVAQLNAGFLRIAKLLPDVQDVKKKQDVMDLLNGSGV